VSDGGHGERAGTDRSKGADFRPRIARLTNSIDCQWAIAAVGKAQPTTLKPLPMGTVFSTGQKLNLKTGLAELTFDSGAKVILHGPTNFTLGDGLFADLAVGRLTAKVPHAAAGFTVNTPSGKVVDLGTEFGVKVGDDRAMHVIVYVGEVKVVSESESAAASAGAPERRGVTIHAGDAIVVGPGQPLKHISPQDEHFVRDLAPLGNKVGSESAYVEFMKSLKPVVWLRMEGKESDRVLHDEMGGPDAKLNWDGPGNPFPKGAVGKSLWLRSAPVKDGGAILANYPKAEHDKLTISLWACADDVPGSARNTMACNWNDSADPPGQFYLGLVKHGPKAGLNVLVQSRDGHISGIEGDTNHYPFPFGQWQHVAFVHDRDTLRLYQQGREVKGFPRNHVGLRFPVIIKSLSIGARMNADGDAVSTTTPDRWGGKLDEIAVFNDALSAEEIGKLVSFGP
jgi:hypothetical protein